MADPGSAPGMTPPPPHPMGPNSFFFAHILAEMVLHCTLSTHPTVLPPPQWQILDPQLYLTRYDTYNNIGKSRNTTHWFYDIAKGLLAFTLSYIDSIFLFFYFDTLCHVEKPCWVQKLILKLLCQAEH